MENNYNKNLIAKITELIFSEGFNEVAPNNLQNKVISLLNESGYSIIRSHIFLNTLHPQIGFEIFRWFKKDFYMDVGIKTEIHNKKVYEYGDAIVEKVGFYHIAKDYRIFQNSPLYYVFETKNTYRYKFDKEEKNFTYSILKDFEEMGVTDYLVLPLDYNFYNNYGVITWVTNKEAGFTDEMFFTLEKLSVILSAYLRTYLEKQLTNVLLSTYLGKTTGEKVLSGQIKRGDIQKIESAIWFSDIRDFSVLSNQFETNQIIDWVNEYFDLISKAILENGGEILKFIGDAVLAIFPVEQEKNASYVCKSALKAMQKANNELILLNEKRETKNLPKLNHGIGLHFGLVEYGNIGASNRLDFTVMGATVNLASRIESLCSKLKEITLMSEDFVKNLDKNTFEYLGEFEVKGFDKTKKIFKL
ncbi:MAG: adenylate/guanylate cyclase domain-containing protein [Candidatus Sericytochromatia bacterium]